MPSVQSHCSCRHEPAGTGPETHNGNTHTFQECAALELEIPLLGSCPKDRMKGVGRDSASGSFLAAQLRSWQHSGFQRGRRARWAQPSDQMQADPFLGKSSRVYRHVKKRPQLENSLNALSPFV